MTITRAVQGTDLARRTFTQGDEFYQLQGDPRVFFNLRPLGDGTFAAWARDSSGKFLGKAKLKPAMSVARFAKLAPAALLYVAVNEISGKLRSIDAKLDRIEQMLAGTPATNF